MVDSKPMRLFFLFKKIQKSGRWVEEKEFSGINAAVPLLLPISFESLTRIIFSNRPQDLAKMLRMAQKLHLKSSKTQIFATAEEAMDPFLTVPNRKLRLT